MTSAWYVRDMLMIRGTREKSTAEMPKNKKKKKQGMRERTGKTINETKVTKVRALSLSHSLSLSLCHTLPLHCRV